MEKNIVSKAFFVFVAGILILPLFSFAASSNNLAISTTPTTNITQTSAKLNGFYNAGTAPSMDVRFEWGDTPTMTNSTSYQTKTGSGTFDATITVQPGKTYFVRAMGVANGFAPVFGSTLSFTTPSYTQATIQTMPATSIVQTGATLNGIFNGGGSATETRFEYANNSSFIGSYFTTYTSMLGNSGSFSKAITGLQSNTTYYFRAIAKNSAGVTIATSALSFKTGTVTPPPTNCTINTFSANPSSITSGSSSALSWTTSNCTDVGISGGSFGQANMNANGSVSTGSLTQDTTFTLTAYGATNTDTQTITVDITTSGGGNDCEIDSFYASPDEIDEGEETTLYWETTNCTDVDISDGIGDVSNDGDIDTDELDEDESFTITATNGNSSDSKTITVEVDDDNGNNNDDECEIDEFYASPSFLPNGGSTTLYWETTDCDDVYISNGVGNVDDDGEERVYNIYSTTTFYITAEGDDGDDSDSVTVSVSTFDPYIPPYVPPTNTHTTTYVTTTSGTTLVDLDITSSFENVGAGERFNVDIDYINNSSSITAKDATLNIILSKDVVFERISRGTYNKADHTIFIKLEDISPKEKGEIVLQVRTSNRVQGGETILTIGTLNYEKNNVKEEVIDVLTNRVNGGSTLGAFAIGGFSGTLISWLVAILLLMIVYAIARQIRKEGRAF